MDKHIIQLINQAIAENPLESGVTLFVNNKQEGAGNFFAKTSGVISGVDVAKQIFEVVNPNLKVNIILLFLIEISGALLRLSKGG